jgi:hypothetical protein
VSLLEVMITSVITVFILSAAGSLYLSSKHAFDYGTSQAYVQRQGTMIQEQISRWAKNSGTVQRVRCGGNGTDGRSLAIGDANGTIRCIYQTPEAADTDADLFVCQVADWTAGCNGGTSYNMLNVTRSDVAGVGALRVRNTTFTNVTCIDPGPCGSGTVALSITKPLIDVSFDLTDNAIPNPQQGTYVGMRFGFGITSRN